MKKCESLVDARPVALTPAPAPEAAPERAAGREVSPGLRIKTGVRCGVIERLDQVLDT